MARVWSLPWAMDGDYYRRTEHALRSLTGDALFAAAPWPRSVNVKACMLSRVPRAQQLFSTEEGASSMSLVPGFGARRVRAPRWLWRASARGSSRSSATSTPKTAPRRWLRR